jgi:phosphopantothenoylcysteine synthetase/decarboxylase
MSEAADYEIRVQEVLDEKWADYFAPFTLEFANDKTILRGTVHDQAELFGALLKIRNLGLKLISVNPMRPL